MEKSIDTLRAEMWRDRYTVIFNQYRALAKQNRILKEEYDVMAQDLDDLYQERCDLKEVLLREKEDSEKYSREVIELRLRCEKLLPKAYECNRLRACLKDMVDAGTQYLAFSQPIAGVDGSRGVQFREALEVGKKEVE